MTYIENAFRQALLNPTKHNGGPARQWSGKGFPGFPAHENVMAQCLFPEVPQVGRQMPRESSI
jgi:hypothetical protein